MLVLLPPSETKRRPRSGPPLDLTDRPEPLRSPTADVLAALVPLCRDDPERAREVLGISAAQADLVALDAELPTAPAAPARLVYTGVLFDALAAQSLPRGARRRADASVWVASALFGAVALGEPIPAYRLSAGTALPGLPPLAALWREPVGSLLQAADPELILDLRPGPYTALWPIPVGLRDRVVVGKVWQQDPADGGARTAVSHHNKATKGRLVRSLLLSRRRPRSPRALLDTVRACGWSAYLDDARLDIVVDHV